ncbi:MAG: hypothetical protein HKN98_01010 [Silicimonas sp.]|nr:hypothetical protein [Silicimonas sp.]
MSHAEDMLAVLEDEFRILTSGRYGDLPELVARKEALERTGGYDGSTHAEQLVQLVEKSERNARLIDAARRGFEAGQANIRDIRKGLSQATYGRDGARRPMASLPGRMERKV